MRQYLEILKKCVLFENIADENLLCMLACLGAKTEAFDKKYTVMSEGYPAKYIGIVLSGSVQITQTDYYGNRSILGNIEASGVFAEAFVCADIKTIPITVTANEQSEIMFIDSTPLLHTCEKNCSFHNQMIFNLMKSLANKTITFQQKIEIISKRTTREKLLAFLMLQTKISDIS